MLELEAVQGGYGLSQVLHGVSLRAQAGEVVSLLGRNGAGSRPRSRPSWAWSRSPAGASASTAGRSRGARPTRSAALGVGYVPEDRRIFSDLTVAENLMVGAEGRRRAGARRARLRSSSPSSASWRGAGPGSLSGGEQQMLTVARTLMGNPRVLLLDEPSEGLAPVIVRALGDQIAALKREGLTILLSEQNLKFAARLADRAYIIEKGEIRFDGPMAALMADEALRREYLTV